MTLGRVAQFELLERLGEGGMGEVFRAMDTMLEREVAIKALRPALVAREDLVERFRVEAIALAKLNHPNIATVYSFLHDQGTYFMVMLYVRGRTLEEVLAARTRLPWAEALGVVAQTLRALEHAHAQGVVHRDLKPANLMVRADGSVVVMDFGIARVLARARQTRSGNLVGTLEYISPEQIQGREVDGRADFYSLGVMLYEMLTGRLPFIASTEFDLLRAHVEATPPPPRDLCGDVTPEVEALVRRSMAKDPSDRFANATEFLRAVEALLPAADVRTPPRAGAGAGAAGFAGAASTAGGRPGGSALAYAKDNPGIAAAALLVLVAAVLWIAGALSSPKPAPGPAPAPPGPVTVVPPAPAPPANNPLPGITIADDKPQPVAPFPKPAEAAAPAPAPSPPTASAAPAGKDPAQPAERSAPASKPPSGWYVR